MNTPLSADFVAEHCADCHDDAVRKGNLDLAALTFRPEDPDNLRVWVKIHDRLRAGQMPPAKRKRPPPADVTAACRQIAAAIGNHERRMGAQDGRAARRRLNAYEHENILRDLFSAPWLQVRGKLPEDGEAFGFNKSGQALDVSHVSLARAMKVADYAMREVISTQLDRPPSVARRYYARDQKTMSGFAVGFSPAIEKRPFPVFDDAADRDVRAGAAPKTAGAQNPQAREHEAVAWVISNFTAGASHQWDEFRAPVAGRYRVKLSGYSVWVAPMAELPRSADGRDPSGKLWRSRKHLPDYDRVSRGRRNEPVAIYTTGAGNNRRVGGFDVTPAPAAYDLGEVWLLAGEKLVHDPTRLFRRRGVGDIQNPLMQADGAPAVAFRWMEVEGPLPEDPVPAGYRLMFGDLPVRRFAGEPAPRIRIEQENPKDRTTRGDVLKEALEGVRFEVVSVDPREDADRLMRGFLARAYRRPFSEQDLRLFLELAEGRLRAGARFAEAMMTAYSAVLASPAFLFVDARPGPLDDFALAERLALFLWNSAPDDELRARAARGELGRPDVLRAETNRLLNDPRSRRFTDAFLDYWIDTRKMEATTPSGTLYNDYEWDASLREAALEETQLFFADLVERDLPARNIVSAPYLFVNERLAAHYSVPGVGGVRMRRVPLPSGSVRGGILTQASVLKVTANGTTTSPVLRGKWILERILGQEVPPPPPVAAVDPDIRGAVTIRQQLDKHRNDPSCSFCHAKVDPLGFALESFDVLGGWRDRYRVLDDELPVAQGRGKDGAAFVFAYGPAVNPAGELPDGRGFAGIQDLKRLLLSDEKRIGLNLAQQLLTYATGAPLRFVDRQEMDRIIGCTRVKGYRVRSLIHAIVQSKLFRDR